MMKSALIVFWLTTVNLAFCQNLINNPDFEIAGDEPKEGLNSKNNFTCLNWTSPSNGTPDYYTTKRIGEYGARRSSWGTRKPYSGKAYVGIAAYTDTAFGAVCEYIQNRLNQKLIKGNYYCLSLYVSPAERTGFSTNELDYFFSSEKLYSGNDFIKLPNYEKFIASKDIFEPKAWNKISACYQAKGDEEYLTIGIFNAGCKRVCFDTRQPQFTGFYFYIDNVSLIPTKNGGGCECNKIVVIKDEPTDYALALDKPLILKNINFETNKAQLMPGSDKELEQLASYLGKNPSVKIEITGHTDNVGNEAENIRLSESRAKSVADFLIKAGIKKDRIIYKGLGSKLPIKSNDTEENRRLNRRVEFKIIK